MPQHTRVSSLSPEVALARHLHAHLSTFLAPRLEAAGAHLGYAVGADRCLCGRSLGPAAPAASSALVDRNRHARPRCRPRSGRRQACGPPARHCPLDCGRRGAMALGASRSPRRAGVRWCSGRLRSVCPGETRVAGSPGPVSGPFEQSALSGASPAWLWRRTIPSPGHGAGTPLAGRHRDGLERPDPLSGLPQLRVRVPPARSPSANERRKPNSCLIWSLSSCVQVVIARGSGLGHKPARSIASMPPAPGSG